MRIRAPLLSIAAITLALVAGACDDARQAPLPVPPAAGFPVRPMTRSIRIQAAYDAGHIYLRVRFPAQEGTRQEYFHRVADAWQKEGGGFRDLAAALASDGDRGDVTRVSANSETVLSVVVNDRAAPARVRDFEKYGCFVACHEFERQMPNWRESDGVVGMKTFPGFGGFADAWTWRAHRTGLAGFAADGSLSSAGLLPDAGISPWQPLSLGTSGEPTKIFDPAQNGGNSAVPWSQIFAGGPFAFDDGTLQSFPDAIANTAGYVAMEDDAVPAQVVGTPTGSLADVTATSTWAAGEWDLRLTRSLVTADATHDVAFAPGGTYDLAFSLHSDDADGRDHYVSLPIALVLSSATAAGATEARIEARFSASGTPSFDEAAFPVANVETFLPGVTSYDFLVGAVVTREGVPRTGDVKHGGGSEVSHGERRCAECHTVSPSDPRPSYRDAGSLQDLVLRRGGVFGPTPFFENETGP